MANSKDLICAALRQIMENQPLESISIRGICDKANISRKTFSRNFTNIQDVIMHQMTIDFIQPINDITRIMGETNMEPTLLIERNLRILKDNHLFYKQVIETYGSFWFVNELSRLTTELSFNPYENLCLDPVEQDFATAFFASANAMTYQWWIKRNMDIPEHEVAQMIWDWVYAHCRELGLHG